MKVNEVVEGTRCWKGYEKKGMKTMFGKRVPNCVKNEADSLIACKDGEYYCNDSKKCKPIPPGHYVDDTGYLVKEDLRAWFGKGKKGGAGGGGWDRYNSKNPYAATKAAAEHLDEIPKEQKKDYISKEAWNLMTARETAVENGNHWEAVKGADIRVKSDDGETVLELASKLGNDDNDILRTLNAEED